MLQITPHHKIFIAVQPVDFRRGIDAIAALCRQQFQLNPMSGQVFIFRNRNARAIKILTYDRQGYWLCLKRLSAGSFQFWPKANQAVLTLSPAQLQVLLYNGDPKGVQAELPYGPDPSSRSP